MRNPTIESPGSYMVGEYTIAPYYQATGRSKGSRWKRMYAVYKAGRFLDEFTQDRRARAFVLRHSRTSSSGNPHAAGVEAIPAKWTRATVSRQGGKVQIRIGGGR